MKENDLQEMSETYRKTRIDVYEQATRPFTNDPDTHKKNRETLKKSVEKLCEDADLKKYRGTDRDTATAVWHHLWTKNRYAGISSQMATREIADIESIFDDYEIFSSEDWNIEASGPKVITCGKQVRDFLSRSGAFSDKQTIGNAQKLVKIVSLARLLIDFLKNKSADTPVLDFIRNGYSDDDVWAIHRRLIEMGYRGDLTALHFMMDLGFQVIKPDIVISKIFLTRGWLRKKVPELPNDLSLENLQGKGKYGHRFRYTSEKMYKPIIDLAREIVSRTRQKDLQEDIGWVTGNPFREFDIFLVKYGQRPEEESGIERTLYQTRTTD
jgi:hypothetical protein